MNEQELEQELSLLNISLSEIQKKQLLKFYQLLIEWNQKINLTRITEKNEVYLKHFYDSLTLTKVIDFAAINHLCDVGSGAGFPGIVLKIVYPHLKITLIDSLQKRVFYLNQIIESLDLKEIEAIHTRAEDYAMIHREKFDIVTARAVANLSILAKLCIPMVKIDGYFIAMKAKAEAEIENAQPIINTLGARIIKIEKFLLPKENSQRTLIQIQKRKNTPNQYRKSKRK